MRREHTSQIREFLAAQRERERAAREATGRGAAPPTDRLGDAAKLDIIERSLRIGDSFMAELDLLDWGRHLGRSGSEDVRNRTLEAWSRLCDLLAHEASHGRFSLLDRGAPRIVLHERECARRGWRSRYSDH